MHRLIEDVFLPAFRNPMLNVQHDGAVLELNRVKLAFTTDSFVVQPVVFPGGDIGSLAVYGTVNDLAMCGALPLFLSAGFILEEGFPLEMLARLTQSMQKAAKEAAVQIVTGDTKVVERGKGDGIFINTTGIGIIEHSLPIHPRSVCPGDVVLLNGDIGRHGMAIMAVREGLAFEGTIESDCAALSRLVLTLLEAGVEIHCLRDLTRGGLASALNEIATTAHVRIAVDEQRIPVQENVRGACELLGLDPLYVANEGRFVAFVPPSDAEKALAIMNAHPLGAGAEKVGYVEAESAGAATGVVIMTTTIGTHRIIDMLSGEQLPRIC